MSIYFWQILPLSERRKQMYADEANELGISYSEALGLPEQKEEHSEKEETVS